ncbi:GNAT family N-acetyltransferase [Gracilibacillus kekensis]|uniref:Predicted acetyltransferase n=1 Tax=Gracilibacillus kekensis TaxID=1027249 RepID=A0A1M7J5Z1_9BACI|nr:GNAT family N-acetyltransferase [Gracilibacillus kekensis]SHM47857.1 Predicted acetyltransferase [Gracilibacillus kekensis]
MQKVKLVEPAKELYEAYLDFYQEWIHSGEVRIPWVIDKYPYDIEKMLTFFDEHKKGIDLPEGWVPDSTYWLINEQEQVLGVVNIRHQLTDYLMNIGGHIGYGIRPSQRQKGYATQLLRLSIEEASKLGIKKILVTCDKNNIASWKTILKNNGVEYKDFIEENGNVVKRFWIEGKQTL